MFEMTEKLEAIHAEAIKRFEQVEEREERKQAVEDMRFAHVPGAQWDEDSVAKRANRPRFTVNRVSQAISQIVGDQRQNRTTIKVRPMGSGADKDTADILTGLIRNIESQSKASNAYDSAFDEVLTGGFGGWRVLTAFADDDVFEQDIVIEPIQSAASSLYFGPSERYDKRDAPFAFLITNIPKSEFNLRYPEEQTASFEQSKLSNSQCEWFNEDSVRVAEYWVRESEDKEIALLSDGRVIDQNEEQSVLDELAQQGITVLKTRKTKGHKVTCYKMNGNKILEAPKVWAGKFIPLIPVFGKTHTIEGKTYVKGIVRDAKDSQRIYNYETSQAIETSALTPKDPYWYTPEMVAGHEVAWRTFNTSNKPFMPFNNDPTNPGPPKRTGAPSVQQSALAMIAQSAADIEATTGVHAASLGNAPQLLSERSVQSQAEKGDRGAFIFTDNLEKSKQYTGEILIDLIPKIYDSQRMISILNADGSTEEVEINNLAQTITDEQTGKKNTVNDLSIGKYGVIADTGPNYKTKREESARQLIELASSSPELQRLALDLIVSNLDINDAEVLTERVRKGMIKQGLVEPTEEEIAKLGLNQPQQPDPNQAALLENIQMDTQQKMADIENKEADTIEKQVKAQQETAKTLEIMIKTMLEKIKAGIPLSQQEQSLLVKQADIVGEGQQAIDPGPNTEQAADIIKLLSNQQQ